MINLVNCNISSCVKKCNIIVGPFIGGISIDHVICFSQDYTQWNYQTVPFTLKFLIPLKGSDWSYVWCKAVVRRHISLRSKEQEVTAQYDLNCNSRFFLNWISICMRKLTKVWPLTCWDSLEREQREIAGIWLGLPSRNMKKLGLTSLETTIQ